MKQYRGCSHLYKATITVGAGGAITYGTPVHVCACKTVARDITDDKEEVWADNELQDETYAGKRVTRTFTTMRLGAKEEAELLGDDEITVSGTKKAYAGSTNGGARPAYAWGYALHDGNPDVPCEVVWAFNGKVESISQVSNTIDGGTGSEGQDIAITFFASKEKYTATGKRNPDIVMPITAETVDDVDTWFEQVVTPDNIVELFTPVTP